MWLAAAAGAVAVGAAVVLGELLAGVFSPSLSPITAVGGAVIDAVPPGVKDWAVALFGTADKVALLAGMALVIAVLAGLAGVVEDRRRFAGIAMVGVFGLVGLAAVLTRAQATFNATALPVVSAVVAAVLLRALIGRLQEWAVNEVPAGEDAAPARRRFLQALAGGAAFTVLGGALASVWRGAAAVVSEARSHVALPVPASAAPPIPAGAEAGVDGMQPLVTPNPDFYRIDTALTVPAINPDTWVLKVAGLVDREVQLSYAELLAKPLVERHVTIACVSNEVGGDLIGNARWLGWPVRELLALAGPQPGADMVLSKSSDGWTAGTPLEVLTDNRDALLAIGMNGEPLPLEHGFPVRMVVPGLYGYVSATKWVTELKVSRFSDDAGYWTPRGWSERGPIKTSSRIDVPRAGRPVKRGTVMFGGVAWAQHTGIAKVELRVNRGPWQQAELADGISLDTWYQWKLALELTEGQYEVQVRATDSAGRAQDEQRRPVVPDGATGFHTIRVDVQP
ncbi:Oxidoreductase molybdopterin binding domain protein [Arthrobacter sp. 9AX]|uniref:molybdopterin-dependent oxidoreductase n=1 Tax=Arthrobacter sp. 9AX TaxID=2653131 RepID=UPI0012F3A91D|nr:molybdopterin-dependent oxidoreductase [Arthrobacter sp. 9AX]VXC65816.1 Oxidoreductase molybdopterin binding domain protein [Arthrobacter sp. 9AX]